MNSFGWTHLLWNRKENKVTQVEKSNQQSDGGVLKQLVDQVQAEAFEYLGRDDDMRSLERWLAKGDHSTAEFKAREIIEQQQRLRNAQQNGLPPVLQRLVDQVQVEAFEYPGRGDDMRSLERWLAKGDHSTAEFKAREIIEQQQQLRNAQQNGLPPVLQRLVDQVQAEAFEYHGRDDDMHSLERWLAKGDHSTVEFKAREIIQQQQQLRNAQQNGLPPALQQLVDQVQAEAFEYPGRGDDMRSLERWLAKGDHSTAEFKAQEIIEQQQQLRNAQQNGLPPALQQLVDQVQAEAFEYPGRDDDMHSLERWLAKGDHSTAEFKAREIIEQQQNLRRGI
jgi:acylphosphatase